jgi:hypothetical protein
MKTILVVTIFLASVMVGCGDDGKKEINQEATNQEATNQEATTSEVVQPQADESCSLSCVESLSIKAPIKKEVVTHHTEEVCPEGSKQWYLLNVMPNEYNAYYGGRYPIPIKNIQLHRVCVSSGLIKMLANQDN